jgi:hypothetical protein
MKWLALIGVMVLAAGCSQKPVPTDGQTGGTGGGQPVGPVVAQPVVHASEASVGKALAILSKATWLDNLVAGERLPPGEGMWAFNVLLHAPDSKASFAKLFATRNHVAQTYALVGLKVTGAETYASSVETFNKDPKKYKYGFGCEGLEITNPKFVELIDTGRLKPAYMVIAAFDPYLENRDRFLKESGQFVINTGFGL